MHTTDKDGNQITLEYAENLLEKFKEFMALAAWCTLTSRSNDENTRFSELKFYTSKIHPGFELGRFWKFVILNTQIYTDLSFKVINGLLDYAWHTSIKDSIHSYLYHWNIYREGLKLNLCKGGRWGRDKFFKYVKQLRTCACESK